MITRRRALPGPEPTQGVAVRAARREVRHGRVGWAAARPHGAAWGAGVPRYPGRLRPLDSPQYPRSSPQRGNHLPAKASQHPHTFPVLACLNPPPPHRPETGRARDWELAELTHGHGAVSPSLFLCLRVRDRNLGHLNAAAQGWSRFCRWGRASPLLPVSPGREGRDIGGAPGVLEAGDLIWIRYCSSLHNVHTRT